MRWQRKASSSSIRYGMRIGEQQELERKSVVSGLNG